MQVRALISLLAVKAWFQVILTNRIFVLDGGAVVVVNGVGATVNAIIMCMKVFTCGSVFTFPLSKIFAHGG